MSTRKRRVLRTLIVVIPLFLLVVFLGGIALFLLSAGYIDTMLHGPKTVLSVPSPDNRYEAYVIDWPCIDGPNQSIYIERDDETRFVYVAHLATDVDAIEKIHWSPDGTVVVFQTQANLIATRVPEYETVMIYLGREWTRREPGRNSTFSSGGVLHKVEAVEFPEPGAFSYRLQGSDDTRTVRLGTMFG